MSTDNSDEILKKDSSAIKHAENLDYLSVSRTFNANVRTTAIFAGISLLLARGGHPLEAMFMLFVIIIINIVGIIEYVKLSSTYTEFTQNRSKNVLFFYTPIVYAIMLVVVILLLIYISYKYHKKLLK